MNVQASGTKMLFGDAAVTAVMGYAIVFLGIVMLMVVVVLLGKAMVASQKKAAVPAPTVPAPQASAAQQVKKDLPAAPGSAGQVKLYDVPDRDAAMIMAIVADKMGKPLNELRFKSIREIKEDQ